MLDLVFAYGTLLSRTPDESVNRLLSHHCRVVASGHVQARLYDLGRFPGAVPSPHRGDKVYGRLLQFSPIAPALQLIDRYEGYDPRHPEKSEFIRDTIDVAVPGRSHTVRAWWYFFNGNVRFARRIKTGRWNPPICA